MIATIYSRFSSPTGVNEFFGLLMFDGLLIVLLTRIFFSARGRLLRWCSFALLATVYAEAFGRVNAFLFRTLGQAVVAEIFDRATYFSFTVPFGIAASLVVRDLVESGRFKIPPTWPRNN